MKKIKRQNPTTKIAMCAGALALMALAPKTHADTSVDALLNKLEQKGVLTVDEAKSLKAENATNSVADFNKSFNSKIQMPDWVTSYKLYGDFRGRFDDVDSDLLAYKDAAGNVVAHNNIRLRYRLRVGLNVNMKDNLMVGFRLGTGDSPGALGGTTGGNPLSNNTTLQGNGSKKFIYVDTAFGRWTAINNDTTTLAATIGKMDNPFQQTAMVFDPDYTPEGGALQLTYKLDDMNSFALNGAGFVIDQLNTRGPFLYGAQAIWNADWTPHVATSLGVAGYDLANMGSIAAYGSKPYDGNLGNTLSGGTFQYHFNPVVADASVTYKLDNFPLYAGAFPIKLAGELIDNPAAPNNNVGWNVGVTFGKAAKRGTWDISYRYQRLEADAWWDQLVDDDNVASFPTSATIGAATGGTDIKGHLVKANYMIFDSLTFTFTAYINDLINNNPIPGAPTGALHVMADLMWKF